MHAETDTRWIVLGTDGRHVSLGRSGPSEAEVMAASEALAAQGLSGWLVRVQGEYYSRRKVTLEPLQRIGAPHDADWQAARAAFHAARRRSISPGSRQPGSHFDNYSRICPANHMAKFKMIVIR